VNSDVTWLEERGHTFYRRDPESTTLFGVDDCLPCPADQANLVGSLCKDGLHRPVLDLDFHIEDSGANPLAGFRLSGPYRLVASSTPGHWHLLTDQPMTWADHLQLLDRLLTAGLISRIYHEICVGMGQSTVRRPGWLKRSSPRAKDWRFTDNWPGTTPRGGSGHGSGHGSGYRFADQPILTSASV
jgi:hypothetical protein